VVTKLMVKFPRAKNGANNLLRVDKHQLTCAYTIQDNSIAYALVGTECLVSRVDVDFRLLPDCCGLFRTLAQRKGPGLLSILSQPAHKR
jgi:hypothetical protein